MLFRSRKQKRLIPTKPPVANIVINVFEDEAEEAEAVTRQVKELTEENSSLNDIAVFYRVNAMSRVLEEAFIRNKIPYQIVRGVEFYNRKEIRDLLAYLKILVNPDDEIALLRIINTPARGIGKTTMAKVRAYAALHNITFFDGLKNAEDIDSLSKAAKARITAFVNMLEQFKKDIAGEVAPLTQRVFAESGLEKSLRDAGVESETALDNANELINAAHIYDQQTEQPSLLDYLQQIALFSDADAYDASNDRVALMTLHSAKGLEFENVFIVGLEHGLLPHERSSTGENDDELEEERRLFFVGITRAKTGLYISCTRYRTVRGQLLRTIPSQFLFELGLDFTEQTAENQNLYNDTGVAQIQDSKFEILNSQFKKGQFVKHNSFGPGTVKEFIDMGENSVVVVKFNSGQTKTLLVKYANLSKIRSL